MSDKQVKVAKPDKAKPNPVKPETTKPASVKPIKAASHGHCIRCKEKLTEKVGAIGQLCAPCDLALQWMHWNVEHKLFRKTIYIPKEPHDGGPSLEYLVSNGYAEHLRKPSRPYLRSTLQAEASPALTM